eukprot:4861061-Karenia_brevis.AAC.1
MEDRTSFSISLTATTWNIRGQHSTDYQSKRIGNRRMSTERTRRHRGLYMYHLGTGNFSELCCRVMEVVDAKTKDHYV